jgi:hypothetical protein
MSRKNFEESWLSEAPEGLGKFETYDAIEYSINNLLQNGTVPQDLGNGLKKANLLQTMYYWYQDGDKIILGVQLEKKPQSLVVMLTGKHPRWSGKPPYASDLYKTILEDNRHLSLRLMSDQSLSDQGKAIWDRLFNLGLNVSIYDRENPGRSFKTFSDKSEMDSYFGHDDSNFKRYQYVLSLDGDMIAETRSFFSIRGFRESIKGML